MTDTDPIPEEVPTQHSSFGFLGSLIGLDKFEQKLFDRLEILMARLDPINTALDNISTQLAQLSTQIGELTAGSVSQAEIDALAAKAQGIADAVDNAIEPDAGEGEPTPTPEPEPTPNP